MNAADTAANVAADAVAVEAIDLTTYEACQKCGAMQTEAQLTKCSTCSLVWYCSDECAQADSVYHRQLCVHFVRLKAEKEALVQELHEQHNIADPYVPYKKFLPALDR